MISIFVNNASASNKQVSKKGNQVTVSFNSPIILDAKKKYQMRCLNANIVYCMPNIFSGVNNVFYYYYAQGHPTIINFDTGLYSLRDINRTISQTTSDSRYGNDSKLIQFSADQATSKIYVTFSRDNVGIDMGFSENS